MDSDLITYKRPQLDVDYDFVAVVDGLPRLQRASFGLSDQIIAMLTTDGVPHQRFDCDSRAEFDQAFVTLNRLASSQQFSLQIISHGNKNGFGIGVSDFVSWDEFGNLLVPINYAMSEHLILNMTTCKGVHGIKSVNLGTTTDPFFGLIGPLYDLAVPEALDVNKRFYGKWLGGRAINEIVREVNYELTREVVYCVSAEGYRALRRGS